MLPSIDSRLDHVKPTPGTGPMDNVLPLTTGLLNRVNTSPSTGTGPRLVTVTVPVPLFAKVPFTVQKLLDGESDSLITAPRLPCKFRLPLMVNAPASPAPGDSVPPTATFTLPPI